MRISHAVVLDKIRRLSQIIRANDVVLGYSGLDGVSAIRYFMGSILNGATRIVNHGPFDPKRFFEIVKQFRVTYTLCPPYRVVQLLNHPEIEAADLSSLRYFTSGGSRLTLDVIHKMNKYLHGGKLCHSFGMTESASMVIDSTSISIYIISLKYICIHFRSR